MRFSKFKPQNNYILVKPITTNVMRKVGNVVLGVPNYIKDQYLKNYTIRHFEVVKTPDKITLPENKRQFAEMGYQPVFQEELLIKPKDIVWVNLQASHNAIKISFKDREGDYFLVHYSQIYVAKRRCFRVEQGESTSKKLVHDDVVWDVIPLHGYVICEKILKKHPYIDKMEEVPGKLKVQYTGDCPVNKYNTKGDKLELVEYHHLRIRPGSTVQLDGPWIPLEGEYFKDFSGTDLVAVERQYIMGLL